MTTTSRYLKHKADHSTAFFRRKGIIILLVLIFFFGTCSAKGGNHKPNNHNTTPDGKAKVGGCQYKGTGDVKKEIDMLNREVKQMNGIVGGLGKKGGNYIELAKHGICSEIQQNGARAFLAGPKVANLTADLNEINKLISQIIDLLNKFISGKGQSDQSAAKLAQDITAIRGKAKPINKKIIDAATKKIGTSTTKPRHK